NRGVGPDQALGGRNWSNYTWHGDQAPGHPFSHGLQTSDVDMNDVRFSKLLIQTGKNLIENKMPEAHWVTEVMERGGKIVVITPEYSPSAQKADYWIPIRNNTDTALFLGITKILIDNKWYDADYVKKFTDFPLLIRTDTLKRVSPKDIIPNYKLQDISDGPSYHIQGLKDEQREIIGDFVVWDAKSKGPKAITRDDVGETLVKKGIDPVLEGSFKLKTIDGKEIEVMTLLEMYKIHLRDYDIDSVVSMTNSPKDLIERLAKDIATIKPVAIHYGEGVNHYFHATLMNRSYYLPVMLTGNVGYFGSGSHTWAGNYKAGNFQASKWSGPGFYGWVAEDVFKPNLDPYASAKDLNIKGRALDEEVAYWNHSERPLIVNTPKYGRKVFTGKTHMPSPTKVLWFTNVNLINNAKHVYQMLKNVNPNIEQIMSTDIEITGSIEYADFAFPANSWVEFQEFEITNSCSNPFIQIWGKTGITPVYESKDDVKILAGMASKLGELLRDKRFEDNWKFAIEGRASVYINRLLDGSTTMKGYTCEDILNGKYGEPGVAMLLFRTYPRHPFWEQVHESLPFYTPTGRLQAYNDEPEIIEYGENFIVHREGPEATPYLPNAIVSTNPYIRPDDYGIPENAEYWEDRTVRNIKKSWEETKKTKNFLWEKGYHFYCVTPKSRHTVHSQWAVTDWNFIWNNNFGDPYRMDKRMPGVGEHQIHIHPQAARDLGIEDGDYVYVDANPADRPYEGWKPNDSFYKVSRLMLRAKYNPAYPYNCTMMKHSAWISSDKTVQAHETRPDGRALSPSGYQSSFRYGSQQSITRDWSMPMHQLDSLFHKAKIGMKFIFGFEADNHCINTVPKETLVKITKAENGGMGGKGVWDPVKTGYTAGNENDFMKKFLNGELIKVDA
ncbi:MAG: molybdopterin-dependent oxidoreductase, partial [Candidatus Kuenenia stuttgartiensis]|nr:molybdopterin-dependent oxidoreductase [Candidatus Kuenenia stuttgartiensis]